MYRDTDRLHCLTLIKARNSVEDNRSRPSSCCQVRGSPLLPSLPPSVCAGPPSTCYEAPGFSLQVALWLSPIRHGPPQQLCLREALLEGCQPRLTARVPGGAALQGVQAARQSSQEGRALRPRAVRDDDLTHTQGGKTRGETGNAGREGGGKEGTGRFGRTEGLGVWRVLPVRHCLRPLVVLGFLKC